VAETVLTEEILLGVNEYWNIWFLWKGIERCRRWTLLWSSQMRSITSV